MQLLQQIVSQDPNNSFARYGLAMELKNSGDLGESIKEFRELLERDENYAASYAHLEQAL